MTVRKAKVTMYEKRVVSSYLDLYKQASLYWVELAKKWFWFIPPKENRKDNSD